MKRTKVALSELVGQTITSFQGLEINSDLIDLFTAEGNHYTFSHEQDCCELVYLADFECDFTNNATVISVEVSESDATPTNKNLEAHWIFYKIETSNGELWLRFFGESNGCYSTNIDFHKIM